MFRPFSPFGPFSPLSRLPPGAWRPTALPLGRVVVAKTTHLGDLVISLPMAAALKRRDPACTVIFLTHRNTADVARCCPFVDEVVAMPDERDALAGVLAALGADVFIQVDNARLGPAARQAGIPIRIGSLFRLRNWPHFTHLAPISRAHAGRNKRLLDLEYLRPLGIPVPDPASVGDLYALAPRPAPRLDALRARRARGRRSIVLSPALVTARAHRWPLASYAALVESMAADGIHWFICGVAGEREQLRPLLARYAQREDVTDLVGALSLAGFMSFVAGCDGLVAGNTGPLHLAAALGVHALGLFPAHPVEVARWGPVGRRAAVIHSDVRCAGAGGAARCPCIAAIAPEAVAARIRAWFAADADGVQVPPT